ncbi:T9SS type A sorting domain-containing protein [Psychroserpens ponticola]|uniref:T9SS type A sorting domain-containing protein n=1 Tax=Psychroserpens ponticola TaxID=2932268 RepID=A0ABY7RXS6_9FLAO|nr:T9SS type A sorting domain-containing protein [Psychroserpens ponticola]WCO00510.1 T9SS type A sorting domain-containing protein [Psychroserpens ponticola]
MKKITLLCVLALTFVFTNEVVAQTLNQNANWPNASWMVTGTYTVAPNPGDAFQADPTMVANFAYNDDPNATGGDQSYDDIAAESPVIDLTAAAGAGETWISIAGNYVYNRVDVVGELLTFQYWDADATNWVDYPGGLFDAARETVDQPTGDMCAGTSEPYTTDVLDISTFTATQLSGFRYRIFYDDDFDGGNAWEYGFCFDSPTIASATPPSCPDPTTLSATTLNTTDVTLEWVEIGSAGLWNIEIVDVTGAGTQTMVPTYSGVSSPYTETMLIPGNEYEFYVQSDCEADGTSNWIGPVQWTQPNLGDVCESAIVVASLPYSVTDDTGNYGNDYDGAPGGVADCGTGNNYLSGDDVVYEYTAASDTSINISLTDIGSTYTGIFVYNDCADIGVMCAAEGDFYNFVDGIVPLGFDFAVTNSETYYIVISTWATPQTTAYTLNITENSCTDATVAYSVVNDCDNSGGFNVLVDLTNMGSSTSIDINDDQGSATQSTGIAGMFTFGPYVNATDVVISITDNDDPSCNLTSDVLTQAACPPANDACVDAIAVNDGDSITGSTIASSNIEGLTACQNGGGSATTGCSAGTGFVGFFNGVWYVYTAGPDEAISVTTDNSLTPFDTEILVFSGDCANLTCVGGDDDGGENASLSTFCWESSATEGNTVDYYIYVDGNSVAAIGDFTLDVSVESTLSTTDFENKNAFTYFPNPVNNELTLRAQNTIQNVSVLNMLGQEVLKTSPNALESKLDMSALTQGAYFVQVTINNVTEIVRVIKD